MDLEMGFFHCIRKVTNYSAKSRSVGFSDLQTFGVSGAGCKYSAGNLSGLLLSYMFLKANKPEFNHS